MPRAYEVIIGTDVLYPPELAVAVATRKLRPISIDGIQTVHVYGADDPESVIGVGVHVVTEEDPGTILDCDDVEVVDEVPIIGEVGVGDEGAPVCDECGDTKEKVQLETFDGEWVCLTCNDL